jgi:hypothetical protein
LRTLHDPAGHSLRKGAVHHHGLKDDHRARGQRACTAVDAFVSGIVQNNLTLNLRAHVEIQAIPPSFQTFTRRLKLPVPT